VREAWRFAVAGDFVRVSASGHRQRLAQYAADVQLSGSGRPAGRELRAPAGSRGLRLGTSPVSGAQIQPNPRQSTGIPIETPDEPAERYPLDRARSRGPDTPIPPRIAPRRSGVRVPLAPSPLPRMGRGEARHKPASFPSLVSTENPADARWEAVIGDRKRASWQLTRSVAFASKQHSHRSWSGMLLLVQSRPVRCRRVHPLCMNSRHPDRPLPPLHGGAA
jgi:hypothetical protein